MGADGTVHDLSGEDVDTSLTRAQSLCRPPVRTEWQRVETPHTHGTGCFLSSAIAAYVALGFDLEKAIGAAKKLLSRALTMPVITGEGRGYPDVAEAARHGRRLRRIAPSAAHTARIRVLHGTLYVITDSVLRPDRTAEQIVLVPRVVGG